MRRIEKTIFLTVFLSLFIFNIGFILIGLDGPEKFYRVFQERVQKEIALVPLLLFGVIIIVLFILFYLKNKKLQFYRGLFFIFILFVAAVNLSLFQQFNRPMVDEVPAVLTFKKNSTLNEAFNLDSSSNRKIIQNYRKIHELLHDKTIIIPHESEIDSDFMFWGIVKPENIIRKEYGYQLNKNNVEQLNKLKKFEYDGSFPLGKIKKYSIILDSEKEFAFYYFSVEKKCFIIPQRIAIQVN